MSASGSQRAAMRTARLLAFVGVLLHATLIPWAAAAMALDAAPASQSSVLCSAASGLDEAAAVPAVPGEPTGHCEHCKGTACSAVAVLAYAPAVTPPTTAISRLKPRVLEIDSSASLATVRNRGPPIPL